MSDALIHFTGNTGDAPKIGYTQSGDAYANVSVAVNKSKKVANTGDGRQDFETLHTTWYRVTYWRELAEAVSAMGIVKGQQVRVTGEVFQDEFQRQDGSAGVSLNVTGEGIRAFPPKQQGGYQQQGQPAYQQPPQQGHAPQPQQAPQSDPWSGQQVGYQDDPIPF